ncbi:hypothetical protein PSECIP111951_00643 [Pseudoalteromonas holothuriae]|uniref:Uncharacterized protein n=1 Tax=Pseudoalteromonas holothuriae TaxID=2963714 RepID=A0ABN8UKR3_9GAMM|nr:hypothetical protein [Pseudoalteromonas sp. CIP111951]CAH9052547.1 hypothetical protein PSECIP111951_00643 [Pseudoalteromonas sp. CIP111951]
MASTNLSCNVEQGFNFQKDVQCLIGHLSELEIFSDDKGKFKMDMAVSNPTKVGGDEETKEKVVGVISNIFWMGGHADPIYIACRISTENKTTAVILKHTILSDTKVKFKFTVYDYDPKDKIFYPCFYCDDSFEGLVANAFGDLEFGVNMDAAGDIDSPKNYDFYIGIMPSEVAQKVNIAFDKDAKITKTWGVTVAS